MSEWADEAESILAKLARERAERRERLRWLFRLGFAARLVVYVALFFTWWIFMPEDISQTPFAALTLQKLAAFFLWLAVPIFLIRGLFNPAEEDIAKEMWGWLGVVMIVGVLGASIVAHYGGY
jgi:hypothetical protein